MSGDVSFLRDELERDQDPWGWSGVKVLSETGEEEGTPGLEEAG